MYTTAARDATALVIDAQTVAWVGDEDGAAVQTDIDVTVNLEGALVTPAFVDAHVHLTAMGLALTGLRPADRSPCCPGRRSEHPLMELPAERRQQLQDIALAAAAAAGIGSVHEMAGPGVSSAADLRSALAARDHPAVEVFGFWGQLGAAQTAAELGAVGAGGDVCGGPAPTCGQIADHLLECTKLGMQAALPALDELPLGVVIAAMNTAKARPGGSSVTCAGHRIEQTSAVVDPAALAATGLLASVRPNDFGCPVAGRPASTSDAGRAHPLADLVAAGIPLAFGSRSPNGTAGPGFTPWEAVRAAIRPVGEKPGLSVRAAFAAHTRGGWRAVRRHGDGTGTISPGTPAILAIWSAGPLVVGVPDRRVARWSTDPQAAVPGLPDLRTESEAPRCLATLVRGRVAFHAGELAGLSSLC